jgi:hypothetical protein
VYLLPPPADFFLKFLTDAILESTLFLPSHRSPPSIPKCIRDPA